MNVLLAVMMMQAATAVPAQPTGKWTVSYEDSMCVLSRTYGPVQIGFKPVTFGEVADVLIIIDTKGPGYRLGRGRLVLRPGEAAIEGRVRSWKVPDADKRVIALEVPRSSLPQIAAATELAISADEQRITIAQINGPKAFAALDACESDLTAVFQPNIEASTDAPEPEPIVADPAFSSGQPARWLTQDDYPAEAVRLRLEGTTVARWIIGTDGRVKKCLVTERSDHPGLDAVVCKMLGERGRYSPARDANGRPIESRAGRRVVWKLPN